ncbi:MAG: alanine racemase, partial [Micromonosporaceae bacterium]
MTGLDPAALKRIAAEPLGPWFRSVPDSGAGDVTVGTIGEAGWRLSDLLLPVLTLRRTVVAHNAELFARWCAEHEVSHAPHGKTTMAPQLFDLQLAAGAWAITAATVAQARLMRGYGVPRILLANQVVDVPGLQWLASDAAAGGDTYVLVDSVAGVDRMAGVLAAEGATRPIQVLLELGAAGGRTGARTTAEAFAVADRIQATDLLALAGVECFEGIYPSDRTAGSLEQVNGFLDALAGLLGELDRRGRFGGRREILLTAGGSCYPDRVVEAYRRLPTMSLPVRCVVRSGGYLTHDDGLLDRCAPFASGAGHPLGSLRPALRLWAYVLSTPEPGLAICGYGKRDAPYDMDL